MAQSRAKRKQRTNRRGAPPSAPSAAAVVAARRRRRVVLAFLVIVGLAGVLAISAPGDDGSGAPPEPAGIDQR